MKLPVQVVFRDLAPRPALEADIRAHAARLDRFAADLASCQVAVESSANRRRQGLRYRVRIDLRLPGAEIVTTVHATGEEDLARSVHGAFDATTRQLEDLVRRRREPAAAPAPRAGDERP